MKPAAKKPDGATGADHAPAKKETCELIQQANPKMAVWVWST
jgi:hypothetical protein